MSERRDLPPDLDGVVDEVLVQIARRQPSHVSWDRFWGMMRDLMSADRHKEKP